MAFGLSDELLPVFVPIAVYWIGAWIYQVMLSPMEQYRLFTKEEEETNNLATPRQVIVGVLINQASQMAMFVLMFKIAGQLAVAILVVDCWEYFVHRWMHENKFLYKHTHAMHHHLIVPYAYGAQYVHPLDALLTEILGGVLATLISGMCPRTTTLFASLLTFKALDDHCGMWFPSHPIHRWMTNNSAFHALHHQHQGIKRNYSVHFLATWDLLLGTYLPFSLEERKGGGFQIQAAKD